MSRYIFRKPPRHYQPKKLIFTSPSSSIELTAPLVETSGIAFTPVATAGEVTLNAELAVAVSESLQPTVSWIFTQEAELIAATAIAFAPVVTAGEVNLSADFTTANGLALDPSISWELSLEVDLTTAAGVAFDPVVSSGSVVNAPLAEASGVALEPVVLGNIVGDTILANTAAFTPVVTTGEVTVDSTIAQANSEAIAAQVTWTYNQESELAQSTGVAFDPAATAGEVQVAAELTTGIGQANDPTVSGSYSGIASLSEAAGTVFDATLIAQYEQIASLVECTSQAFPAATTTGEVTIPAPLVSAFGDAFGTGSDREIPAPVAELSVQLLSVTVDSDITTIVATLDLNAIAFVPAITRGRPPLAAFGTLPRGLLPPGFVSRELDREAKGNGVIETDEGNGVIETDELDLNDPEYVVIED